MHNGHHFFPLRSIPIIAVTNVIKELNYVFHFEQVMSWHIHQRIVKNKTSG